MDLLIYSAFIVGLAYCAAPGVVNAEGVRRGLHHGFRTSFVFQMGSLATGTLWAIVMLSGLVILRAPDDVKIVLSSVGGLVLLWMAFDIFRKERRGGEAALPSGKNGLTVGALIAFASPFAPIFWLSVGGRLLSTKLTTPLVSAAIIVITFVVVQLIWSLLIAGLSAYGRRFVGGSVMHWINMGAGVMMALFALTIFWQNVSAIVPSLSQYFPPGFLGL